MAYEVAIRWTVGDVSPFGFEALQLSILGAHALFGPAARYVVCVNTIDPEEAARRTGEVPEGVAWRDSTAEVPGWLETSLDGGMAEGVAWKLAPVRLFPEVHELSLDNDCILWGVPDGLDRWLARDDVGLLAEDVRTCFGRFSHLCGPEPRNAGLRGLPPHFDLERALRELLEAHPGPLTSELDEQGLQVAAMSRLGAPLAVGLDDLTVCSPFPPHLPHLGRRGAHFCGLNARELPWSLNGEPASSYVRAHWQRHRGEVRERVARAPR